MFHGPAQVMAMPDSNKQITVADMVSYAAFFGAALGSLLFVYMNQKPMPAPVKVKPKIKPDFSHDVVVRKIKVTPVSSHQDVNVQPSTQGKKKKHHLEQVRHPTGRQRFLAKQESARRGDHVVRFYKPKQQSFISVRGAELHVGSQADVNKLLKRK